MSMVDASAVAPIKPDRIVLNIIQTPWLRANSHSVGVMAGWLSNGSSAGWLLTLSTQDQFVDLHNPQQAWYAVNVD